MTFKQDFDRTFLKLSNIPTHDPFLFLKKMRNYDLQMQKEY